MLQADSPELTKPPTTPEIEEPIRQPKHVNTSRMTEDLPSLHDPANNLIVEGKALHIISDSSRLYITK